MRRARLAFVAAAGAALLFGACGGGADRLTGTAWTLATVDGHAALPEPTAWLRFDSPHQFEGSTGCNSLGGTWKSSGAKLTFSEIRTTLIGCPGPVGDQEAAFNAGLAATRSHAIEDETLRLMDEGGAVRMTFTARPAATAVGTP